MDTKRSIAAALAALALLAAGCGGDDEDAPAAAAEDAPAATGGGDSDQAVKYSECMRENGVPEFPDPENGRLLLRAGPGTGIDPQSPEFQAAQEACRELAPSGAGGGGAPNPQLEQQVLAYAKCMRENGVPDFPDPEVSGNGVRMRAPQGVDPNSPQFQQAQQACQEHLSSLGGTP